MAGMTPPPGFYASSFTYLYTGSAGGDAALSWTLSQGGTTLPPFPTLRIDAAVKAKANVALDVVSAMWVAPEKMLGGHVGFGVLAPFGYQGVDVDIKALSDSHLSRWPHLAAWRARAGFQLHVRDGRSAPDRVHRMELWQFPLEADGARQHPGRAVTRKRDLVNIGFNRWAADLTGSLTWFDPASGWEVSVAPGVTFNGENPDTNYKTGTELHVEAAVMKRITGELSVGLAGYHYRQITGDSGAGAVLGPFKGEVSAIGPNLTYNFQLGTRHIFTSVRWLHEFKATNRMAGDAGFITVTVPIGESKSH